MKELCQIIEPCLQNGTREYLCCRCPHPTADCWWSVLAASWMRSLRLLTGWARRRGRCWRGEPPWTMTASPRCCCCWLTPEQSSSCHHHSHQMKRGRQNYFQHPVSPLQKSQPNNESDCEMTWGSFREKRFKMVVENEKHVTSVKVSLQPFKWVKMVILVTVLHKWFLNRGLHWIGMNWKTSKE